MGGRENGWGAAKLFPLLVYTCMCVCVCVCVCVVVSPGWPSHFYSSLSVSRLLNHWDTSSHPLAFFLPFFLSFPLPFAPSLSHSLSLSLSFSLTLSSSSLTHSLSLSLSDSLTLQSTSPLKWELSLQ